MVGWRRLAARSAFQDCGISGPWLPAGKLPVNLGRVRLRAKDESGLVFDTGHADRTVQRPRHDVNSS